MMIRAMAPRPPTTPPTMGPTGVEEPLSGWGEGVMKMVVAVEEGGFCRELLVGAEVVSGVLDEGVDVELMKGVYQIWPVPAATAQPSRL